VALPVTLIRSPTDQRDPAAGVVMVGTGGSLPTGTVTLPTAVPPSASVSRTLTR
jgi:hypothetical protein